MKQTTGESPMDREWLCAAAAYCYGTGTPDQLAEASLAWLPSAPPSESLYHLADDFDAAYTRCEDIHDWISDVILSVTGSELSEADFRWIATQRAMETVPSHDTAVSLARFLNTVALFHAEELDLLGTFVVLVDDLDDGLDAESIRSKIIAEYHRIRGDVDQRFRQHFRSRPNHAWVISTLERDARN